MKDDLGKNVGLMSRVELAKRWCVSIATIRRREKDGTLNVVKINPRIFRYKISDIEEIEAKASRHRGID